MNKNISRDIDPIETEEWIESIQSVMKKDGQERVNFLFSKMCQSLSNNFDILKIIQNSDDYVNSIHVLCEPKYPGDEKIEKKIRSFIRWNAIMMVLRASKKNLDLGGHISSFQSSANIYEVCFNHFFRAFNKYDSGDLIYFQGHISPGIYSRAFLEGRLNESQIDHFRQETNSKFFGLSSYPHPKLMPNFWQFPTVSMGLCAVSSIYQARFLKYLKNRNLKDTSRQKVYAFLGDGEMDEAESKGVLSIASRERLDNLIFVINCNLQRLDGPVLGNGKIINELSRIFLGSGWYVIKVIWGSKWDAIFKKDSSGILKKLMQETLDGDYQYFNSKNGKYIRKKFFGKYIETKNLVKDMTDDEIEQLNHGGHDSKKIYAAFHKANLVKNKPVVILFHTIKGYGLGNLAEGKNIAHQVKNMQLDNLKYFKKRFSIPVKDNDILSFPYLKFSENSKEFKYLHNQRKKLFGYVPFRLKKFSEILSIPNLDFFSSFFKKNIKNFSTTVAFVRILNILLNYIPLKDRIVPIVADESRTFGMEGLFRKIGIYNNLGQLYTPSDKEQFLYYKEDKKGQMLQEGINELGAGASWLSAATSYSTNDFPMIPFYIYYSMFGFQRIGDLLWLAGDQQARGFLIGATSGRTTLNGEGLQHADGHSHIYSLTIPNCISYDPSYGYELAVILHSGLKRMYGISQENIFYYITTVNETYEIPEMPKNSESGIIKGIYLLESLPGEGDVIQLLGSGAILTCVRKAAKILSLEYKIKVNVYSVTSFTEIARDGQDCIRWNLLHPLENPKIPYIKKILKNYPTVAVTDYIKLFSDQIRQFVPSSYFYVLGTDGFGRSDSRENLRNFFEINEFYIVCASLKLLVEKKIINSIILDKALKRWNISMDKTNPRLA